MVGVQDPANFLRAIAAGADFHPDFETALKTKRILEAVEESNRSCGS